MSHPPGDAFLDALDDLFLVFDESGAVIEWNQAVLEVTGRSCDEITELTADAFFAAADADRIDAIITTVLRTGEATIEADIVAADGHHVPYAFNAHRVSVDGSLAIASLGRDQTERIRQRERIEARERALRDMYEIIADRDLEFTEQVHALLEVGRNELEVAYGTLSRIDGSDYVFEVVDTDDDSIQAGDVVPLSATNCELAASDEQTLVLGDVARDAPDQTDRTGYAEWGISCYQN
ncbi:PAS domain S-box-containing protein [Halopenitus malekzadehii]|uniref:PAS domain S-box-containing protein n=1 Tax=Halopenitus malekzadehii TaxID=1267564 RepID=A0A1H6K175_9EURY|nr:PAS domain S-box protein [Halopenitus malekzadehii]SEH66050.1 PAS domain S-box-containing protein [Halopenitus malekzadehii]